MTFLNIGNLNEPFHFAYDFKIHWSFTFGVTFIDYKIFDILFCLHNSRKVALKKSRNLLPRYFSRTAVENFETLFHTFQMEFVTKHFHCEQHCV